MCYAMRIYIIIIMSQNVFHNAFILKQVYMVPACNKIDIDYISFLS